MDYGTNGGRRTKAGRATHSVALLIPDIANPFYAELTRGTQLQLTASGFTQILADTQESSAVEEQALQRVSKIADGVLLAASRVSNKQLRAAAQACPIVLINRVLEGFSSVWLDTGVGVEQALDHLISLGHRDVAYLSGPRSSWSDGLRWRALRVAAKRKPVRLVKLGPFAPMIAAGPAAADAAVGAGVTACIAFNDLLAIGAMRRLKERGVHVPGELSLVGCDNVFGSDFCSPPLTTVAGDLQRLGRTAVQLLLAKVEDPNRTDEVVALPTHLQIRRSTSAFEPPADA